MKSGAALARAPFGAIGQRRANPRSAGLSARLRAPWLDRQLAAGVPSWHSRAHAARALQLTSDRNRRRLARFLERLVERAEERPAPFRSASVPPCRAQVREARPLMLAIALRLRTVAPVDARGIARLMDLLSDGGGPCYVPTHPHALSSALLTVDESLDVPD